MRLLLLEDDARLRRSYVRRLRADGHAVDEVNTLSGARDAVRDVDYDCLVLDRLVPDGDSLDIVDELSAQPGWRPVLLISALGGPDHRVRGLEAGAGDYLPKPASLEELAVRVRKLLLRRPVCTADPPIRLGRVTVHRARGEVHLDGEVVALTPTEHTLLGCLAERAGEVVASAELIESVDWAQRDLANPLPPHLSRLRKKLGGALELATVRGRGYVLRVIPAGTSI